MVDLFLELYQAKYNDLAVVPKKHIYAVMALTKARGEERVLSALRMYMDMPIDWIKGRKTLGPFIHMFDQIPVPKPKQDDRIQPLLQGLDRRQGINALIAYGYVDDEYEAAKLADAYYTSSGNGS